MFTESELLEAGWKPLYGDEWWYEGVVLDNRIGLLQFPDRFVSTVAEATELVTRNMAELVRQSEST